MIKRSHGYVKHKKVPKSRSMPEDGTVVHCSCGYTTTVPDVPAKCPFCRNRMSIGTRLGKEVTIVG